MLCSREPNLAHLDLQFSDDQRNWRFSISFILCSKGKRNKVPFGKESANELKMFWLTDQDYSSNFSLNELASHKMNYEHQNLQPRFMAPGRLFLITRSRHVFHIWLEDPTLIPEDCPARVLNDKHTTERSITCSPSPAQIQWCSNDRYPSCCKVENGKGHADEPQAKGSSTDQGHQQPYPDPSNNPFWSCWLLIVSLMCVLSEKAPENRDCQS